MGPLSTIIRMWEATKFAELRGVIKENAGKYCVKLCCNTYNVTPRRDRATIIAVEKQ